MFKPLPVGIEFFEKLIKNDYYYVDKTLFIKELIDNHGEVNLFTRPRRFGKTLTLDMLRCFFEEGRDPEMFKGLKIMDAGEKYTSMMGKYPVIFLTLKSAKTGDEKWAFSALRNEIAHEFDRHSNVLKSGSLDAEETEKFKRFRGWKVEPEEYAESIKFLCQCIKKVSGKNTILLIDEYDVPLESSFYDGYYDHMVRFIRSLFENSLKTNDCLEFAVITGCLRISKESIFTGLNNLKINSIRTPDYGEYFGFTDEEVYAMLEYYGLSDKYEEVRSWYNGYIFGGKNVYNPWSTIMYLSDHIGDNRDFLPMSYWANTSSNSIVKDLVERADNVTKGEIERLIEWGSIEKPIHEDITYGEIYKDQDNLWNFLYFTGYLKAIGERGESDVNYATLVIPNRETRYIYSQKIINWFGDEIVKKSDRSALFTAMLSGDAKGFEAEINKLLKPSISYFDSKEAFYHGFMSGLFVGAQDFAVRSNRESGSGRSDLLVLPVSVFDRAFVIEIKAVTPKKGQRTVTAEDMDIAADEALKQITDLKYTDALMDEGYGTIGRYGISFFRKDCRVHYLEGYPEENEDISGQGSYTG
ncbi:MAG: AAA family ATPase [Lachnospiraceae bacterium]|nr:AAA family ATPase [Lachnospiraceae bacterium]